MSALPKPTVPDYLLEATAFSKRAAEIDSTPDNRPIWEVIEELGRGIPDSEWDKLPGDGSINYRHYLYGHPKVEP